MARDDRGQVAVDWHPGDGPGVDDVTAYCRANGIDDPDTIQGIRDDWRRGQQPANH